MITKLAEKTSIPHGAYRGVMAGYNVDVEYLTPASAGVSVRTIEGIRGMSAVILVVDVDGEGRVYEDKTLTNMSLRHESEPVTPNYLKQLVSARKRKIGPAVAAVNAALINRANELLTSGSISISLADVLNGVPADSADLIVESFKGSGFAIELTSEEGDAKIKISV